MNAKEKKEIRKKVGAYLKQRRENDLQVSARQLSFMSNLEHSKLVKIEKGLIDFRFDTLLEIALTYKIHPRDLMIFHLDFSE
jgi:hypothetical protein